MIRIITIPSILILLPHIVSKRKEGLYVIFKTSTPNLSAVENGKKNVPKNWIPIIIDHYHLNEAEINDLEEAIAESKTHMKLNMQNSGILQRKTALQFARSFDGMDDETAQKIMNLLEGDD